MVLAERRIRLALAGALAALAAGALIAWGLVHGHRGEGGGPPPASKGGLVIDSSGASLGGIDAAKPLRCFVAGRFVGEMTLGDCAQRNGVATDALDVGADASGALSAQPPRPQPVRPAAPVVIGPRPAPSGAAPAVVGACWRYADDGWRRLPSDTTLSGCVQALFAGRCEPAGGAAYGRWGQQTIRLVTGRVEVSTDAGGFRTLAEQGPGCTIPGLG